jgi:hypothetical protein
MHWISGLMTAAVGLAATTAGRRDGTAAQFEHGFCSVEQLQSQSPSFHIDHLHQPRGISKQSCKV